MIKIMLVMQPQLDSSLRQILSSKQRTFFSAEDSTFCSEAMDKKPDFMIIQIQKGGSFYIKNLLALHQQGIKPFLILFDSRGLCQYATSSPVDIISNKMQHEIVQIDSCIRSILPGIHPYSHVDAYTARFEATEYLREILSGVSAEVFSAIVKQQKFCLAPHKHILVLAQVTSFRRFDDYTFNRNVFYFLEEIVRKEVYALLEKFEGGEFFAANKTNNCILLNAPTTPSTVRFSQQVTLICRELINILNDGYYTFYISKLICTPPDINLAYRKLLHTSNYKPLFPDHVIISSDDILMRKHSPDYAQLRIVLQKIESLTIESDDALFAESFHQLFEIPKNAVSMTAFHYCCNALSLLHAYFSSPLKAGIDSVIDTSFGLKDMNISQAEQYFLSRFLKTKRLLIEESQKYDSVTKALLKYIQGHYKEKISLDALASHVGLSRVYVCKRFKENVGINLSNYLRDFRIAKAKELLRDGRYRISEIACMVGFQNEKYFSRVFHQVVGMTPTEFVRNPQNGLL